MKGRQNDDAPGGELSPPGALYLVSTPIGNLGDITARALETLRTVDRIAAEDTRVTRKLLARFDIHTPLVRYDAHAGAERTGRLLDGLRAGERIALVSDAGTPCLSDPGAELVTAAIDAGVRVEPIPGPSALLAALVASGLPPARFVFEGFLPRTNDRRERLAALAREERTVVLYESSPRLVATLEDLARHAGPDRRVAVARELTKAFEEFVRGTLAGVAERFRQTPPRGECVIVLAGTPPAEAAPDPEGLLRDALARGLSVRDAARDVAAVTGLAKSALYEAALRLRHPATPREETGGDPS